MDDCYKSPPPSLGKKTFSLVHPAHSSLPGRGPSAIRDAAASGKYGGPLRPRRTRPARRRRKGEIECRSWLASR